MIPKLIKMADIPLPNNCSEIPSYKIVSLFRNHSLSMVLRKHADHRGDFLPTCFDAIFIASGINVSRFRMYSVSI